MDVPESGVVEWWSDGELESEDVPESGERKAESGDADSVGEGVAESGVVE